MPDNTEGSTTHATLILTPNEKKLEYKRQCAIETVNRLETEFETIKSTLFKERLSLIDAAIANVVGNKDPNLVKRIESAQLRTTLHLTAAEKRRVCNHLCLQNVCQAYRLIFQHQAEYEILQITSCRDEPNEPVPFISSRNENYCADPTFKRPTKRPKPIEDLVESKRLCVNGASDNLHHVSHVPLPHHEMSPIAVQLSFRPQSKMGKVKGSHNVKTRLGKTNTHKNFFLPDESPCLIYRLRIEDVKSDVDFFRNISKTFPNRNVKSNILESHFEGSLTDVRRKSKNISKFGSGVHSNNSDHNGTNDTPKFKSQIPSIKNGLVRGSVPLHSDSMKKSLPRLINRKSPPPFNKTSGMNARPYVNGSILPSTTYNRGTNYLKFKRENPGVGHTTATFASDRAKSDMYLTQGSSS